MKKLPDILVVFTDQQHKYAYGRKDSAFITPNLDKLCDEGVSFERAYSANPICGPYRGCLFSGKYSCNSGVLYNGDYFNDGEKTLADALADRGYQTCFVGKWHLGSNRDGVIPENMQGGFEHFTAYQCHNGFDPNPPHNNKVAFWNKQGECQVYYEHRTEVTTKIALEKLEILAENDKPFFMCVAYQSPHYPLQPLPEFEKLYEGRIFEKSEDYVSIDPYTETFNPPSAKPKENCPDYQRYGNNMDEYMRMYAAMVSQIDRSVGSIVEFLKANGRYDNTLIIFTSDHGDMQGSHGLKNKCVSYEKSCGVPLIIKAPEAKRGLVSTYHLSTVDISATILDAADAEGYMTCDGKSFLSHLNSGDDNTESIALSEYHSRNKQQKSWAMICYKNMKLTVDRESFEPFSLFDLSCDQYEMNDLKDLPSKQNVIDELCQKLRSALK